MKNGFGGINDMVDICDNAIEDVQGDSPKKIVERVNGCSCYYGNIRYPFWSMGNHAGAFIDVDSAEVIRDDAQWLYISVESMGVGYESKKVQRSDHRLIFREDKVGHKLYCLSQEISLNPKMNPKICDNSVTVCAYRLLKHAVVKKNLQTNVYDNGNSGNRNESKGIGRISIPLPLFFVLVIITFIMIKATYDHYGNIKQQPSQTPRVEQQVNRPAKSEKSNATESVKENSKPQKTKTQVAPIAKSNVITGYDMAQPFLNDGGYSELTIDNSLNSMPVYVRVWDMDYNIPVRAFYIDSGDEFTAEDLDPGTYEVRYIELYDNDVPAEVAKSTLFVLEQYETTYGINYSQYTLTLYKVRNGNTTTTSIPADSI